MKRIKSLFTLLLATILAFGISAPALAEGELLETQIISITSDDIVITYHQHVPYREPFTLRVEVDLPEGVEIVSYQWLFRQYSFLPWKRIDGATDSVLHGAYGDSFYPEPTKISGKVFMFCCEITFVLKDAQGNVTDTAVIPSNYTNALAQPLWKPGDVSYERKLDVKQGDSFTLRVDVNAPEGVEVSYEWTRSPLPGQNSETVEGATGPELYVAFGGPLYPQALYPFHTAEGNYCCDITLVEKDADGNIIETVTTYARFTVYMDSPARRKYVWEFIWYDLITAPIMGGIAILTVSAFFTGWPLIFIYPIVWLIGLFK